MTILAARLLRLDWRGLALVGVLVACAEDPPAEAPHVHLAGRTFLSDKKLGMGLRPDGEEALGNWVLEFGEHDLTWIMTDTLVGGPYTIDGLKISALILGSRIEASFEPDGERLFFAGQEYSPAPE